METTLTPRLPIAASLMFGELADAYMLAYHGRDPSRAHRLEFWKSLLDLTAAAAIGRAR